MRNRPVMEQLLNIRDISANHDNEARDEINALLNYGYAILESRARRCVNTAGLDHA